MSQLEYTGTSQYGNAVERGEAGSPASRSPQLMTTGVSPRNVANSPLRLAFDAGTLIVEGLAEGDEPGLPGVKYDYRTKVFRAEAIWYRSLVEHIRKQ